MRITVNLATRPYVQLDRLFRLLRIAIVAMAVLAIALMTWLHSRSASARAREADLAAIEARTAALNSERARNEARLREPGNAAVLRQIDFLNALYQRKSFSWTAVLMDLEEVLPTGLQVTSIDPQIAANGEVNIRMRVIGPRERSVQLIRNLEASHRFVSPRLVGETQQAQEKTGAGVQMAAAYLNGPQTDPTALVNSNSGNGAPTGPPPTDFDIVAGYNPLQLRLQERAPRPKASAEDAGDKTAVADAQDARPASSALPGRKR